MIKLYRAGVPTLDGSYNLSPNGCFRDSGSGAIIQTQHALRQQFDAKFRRQIPSGFPLPPCFYKRRWRLTAMKLRAGVVFDRWCLRQQEFVLITAPGSAPLSPSHPTLFSFSYHYLMFNLFWIPGRRKKCQFRLDSISGGAFV